MSLGIINACLGVEVATTPGGGAGAGLLPLQLPTIQQMNPTIQQMNPTIQQNSLPVWRPNATTTINLIINIIDSVYETKFFFCNSKMLLVN